jgi:hypothetical protein
MYCDACGCEMTGPFVIETADVMPGFNLMLIGNHSSNSSKVLAPDICQSCARKAIVAWVEKYGPNAHTPTLPREPTRAMLDAAMIETTLGKSAGFKVRELFRDAWVMMFDTHVNAAPKWHPGAVNEMHFEAKAEQPTVADVAAANIDKNRTICTGVNLQNGVGGERIVPAEPTDKMMQAGVDVVTSTAAAPIGVKRTMGEVYKAMLDAAPKTA